MYICKMLINLSFEIRTEPIRQTRGSLGVEVVEDSFMDKRHVSLTRNRSISDYDSLGPSRCMIKVRLIQKVIHTILDELF